MALHMREILIRAVLAHAHGEIEKHKANVNVYLENPAGIGEHSDIIETLELEIEKLSNYHDNLEMLVKYFPKTTESDNAKKQSE